MMPNARNAYLQSAIQTASPARLLVMLCERLVLDVQRGVSGLESGDREESHKHLTHAQDIVTELQNTLRPDQMKGGPELAALYAYVNRRLVTANIHKDLPAAREALTLVTEICATWRDAALAAATADQRSA